MIIIKWELVDRIMKNKLNILQIKTSARYQLGKDRESINSSTNVSEFITGYSVG